MARAFYLLVTITAIVFGLLLGQYHRQLDQIREQFQAVTQQVEDIKHQQCLDANQTLRAWQAQVHDPAVTYRKCEP